MRWNGKSAITLICVILGLFILLKWLIPAIGWLLGLVMPILILALGFYGIKQGRKVLGTALLLIGGIMLLGKASAYLGLILAGVLIYFGISVIMKQKKAW